MLESNKDIDRKSFRLFLCLGLIIRLLFASFSFHQGDLNSWKLFGAAVYDWNISPFLWQAQGPLNSLPIMLFEGINYVFPLGSHFNNIGYHAAFIVGDLLLISVVYLINKDFYPNHKYIYTIIVWYSALFIFISSVWGQTEQWMLAFMMMSFYLIAKKRLLLAGIFLGSAISFKYIPVLIAPYILAFYRRTYALFWFGLGVIMAITCSFFLVFLLSILLYNDPYYFVHFIDRSATIFGNYVPTQSSSFVATGSSIWGELYNLRVIDATVLSSLRDKWLLFYSASYFLVGSVFIWFWAKMLKTREMTDYQRFIFLNVAFISVTIPFLVLYPQAQLQRLLNLFIPMYYIFFALKIDISFLLILNILVIVANDVYIKGEMFQFQFPSLLLTTILLGILFSLQTLFHKSNRIELVIIALFVFVAIYVTGTPRLHFVLSLINNGLLVSLGVSTFLIYMRKFNKV